MIMASHDMNIAAEFCEPTDPSPEREDLQIWSAAESSRRKTSNGSTGVTSGLITIPSRNARISLTRKEGVERSSVR